MGHDGHYSLGFDTEIWIVDSMSDGFHDKRTNAYHFLKKVLKQW
jgi:hypothetical protein